jgi:hypothetical protein
MVVVVMMVHSVLLVFQVKVVVLGQMVLQEMMVLMGLQVFQVKVGQTVVTVLLV